MHFSWVSGGGLQNPCPGTYTELFGKPSSSPSCNPGLLQRNRRSNHFPDLRLRKGPLRSTGLEFVGSHFLVGPMYAWIVLTNLGIGLTRKTNLSIRSCERSLGTVALSITRRHLLPVHRPAACTPSPCPPKALGFAEGLAMRCWLSWAT